MAAAESELNCITPGATVELLVAVKNFDCAYMGQQGKVWRVRDNGLLYLELRCGHPLDIAIDKVRLIAPAPAPEVEPARPSTGTRKEKNMARKKVQAVEHQEEPVMKQAVIPDGKGIIPVQGYESQVKQFKTSYLFAKQLGEQVESGKTLFRDLAAQVVERTQGDVRRVEFLSDDGSAVPVSLNDTSKDGNRTSLGSDETKALMKLGVSLEDLSVTETETSYTLTGEFVAWLQGIIQENYVSKGKPVPEDIKERAVTRLSVEGVAKLQKLAKEAATENERQAAKYLLATGIKAASVSVR